MNRRKFLGILLLVILFSGVFCMLGFLKGFAPAIYTFIIVVVISGITFAAVNLLIEK